MNPKKWKKIRVYENGTLIHRYTKLVRVEYERVYLYPTSTSGDCVESFDVISGRIISIMIYNVDADEHFNDRIQYSIPVSKLFPRRFDGFWSTDPELHSLLIPKVEV